MPKLWQHVNKYIELYNSIDLTIGPKLLISCPLDFAHSQRWFVDLWNGQIAPTMIDIIREGIQVYDTKIAGWEDPKVWLRETLPWSHTDLIDCLSGVEPRDIGYDSEEIELLASSDEVSRARVSRGGGGGDVIKRRVNDDDFLVMQTSRAAQQKNRAAQFMSCQNTPAKTNMCRNSNDSDKLLSMLLKLQEATMRSSISISEEQSQQQQQQGQYLDGSDALNFGVCSAKAFESAM